MSLPSLTVVQRDFSAGQITERAARRDDLKLQRAGLRRSVNTRPLASGALAQRFGRSAYATGNGRTETVRISSDIEFEFLFTNAGLEIRDDTGALVGDFAGMPWTLDSVDKISMAQVEREIVLAYQGTSLWYLRLGASATISGNDGTPFGDAVSSIDYPDVAGTATSTTEYASNTHIIALPAGIVAGDWLVVVFRSMNQSSPATPAGWTLLDVYANNSTGAIYVRRASGAEGSTLTITTSSAQRAAHIAYRITNGNAVEGDFDPGFVINPPSLTPSWGARKTLSLAIVTESDIGGSSQVPAVTAAPSGYGNVLQARAVTPLQYGVFCAGADKDTATSPQDPGAFTLSTATVQPYAATVAVESITETTELRRAFDATTSRASSQCLSKASATSLMLGIDLSADPSACVSAKVYGSNDAGFVAGGTPNVTITLYGKNGSAPASPTDGTSLGSTGPTADTADESAGRTVTSSDSLTAYDYLWVVVAQGGSAATMYIAQVVFTKPVAAVSDTNWILSAFRFEETAAGAKRQPYYRYATRGIAMTCSARTGTINVTFDGPALDPLHVGTSFRFHGRELMIRSVTSAQAGTAAVIEKLPPTVRVVCTTANGRDSFRLGDVVLGETSGAVGLAVAFNSTTGLDVIVYEGSNFIDTERIASGAGSAVVSGTPAEITLAASPVWDEALMSDYRGWPRSASYDRSRVTLSDFPQVPRGIAWGAVGAARDLAVGADADSGFLEYAPGNVRVLHVVGGPDQFVITDQGVMYIPISEASPLQPGSVAFRQIAAIGALSVRPVAMQEGIVYAAADGKTLIGIIPTGQTAFPYRAASISDFHADLFTSEVRALAAMSGGGTTAEQYLWVLLAGGTALVGKFDPSNEWVGFVPVTGEGTIKWISALGGEVRFNVQYQADDSDLPWAIETLDKEQYVDGGVPLNLATPALRPDPDDSSGRLWFLAGLDVALMDGTTYLGTRAVDSNGDLVEESGDDFSAATVMAGLPFTLDIGPWLPNEGEGPERGQRRRRRRVKKAIAVVQDATEFTFMGRTFGGAAPADGTYLAPGQGRTYDPEVPLTKAKPGPFTLVDLDAEVTI
jgi:hypothetical protein